MSEDYVAVLYADPKPTTQEEFVAFISSIIVGCDEVEEKKKAKTELYPEVSPIEVEDIEFVLAKVEVILNAKDPHTQLEMLSDLDVHDYRTRLIKSHIVLPSDNKATDTMPTKSDEKKKPSTIFGKLFG